MLVSQKRFTWENCADGSKTLFDAQFGESYKSKYAAQAETIAVYLVPGIFEHPQWQNTEEHFHILELGFGLGSNFRSLWNHLQENAIHKNVNFASIERDLAACNAYLEKEPHPACEQLLEKRKFSTENFQASLLIGNFLSVLQELPAASFDCIFFDPFSPKSNPEAWELAVFQECARVLRQHGRLVSYSVSRIAKENATNAGFHVEKRVLPEILHKRSSLLARKCEKGFK